MAGFFSLDWVLIQDITKMCIKIMLLYDHNIYYKNLAWSYKISSWLWWLIQHHNLINILYKITKNTILNKSCKNLVLSKSTKTLQEDIRY